MTTPVSWQDALPVAIAGLETDSAAPGVLVTAAGERFTTVQDDIFTLTGEQA